MRNDIFIAEHEIKKHFAQKRIELIKHLLSTTTDEKVKTKLERDLKVNEKYLGKVNKK